MGSRWHYLRYLQHRWPEIGGGTGAQLSYCKLNSPTVARKATSLWSHPNRRVLKKTAIALCPILSRVSSKVFGLWPSMEVTLLKEKFCLLHQRSTQCMNIPWRYLTSVLKPLGRGSLRRTSRGCPHAPSQWSRTVMPNTAALPPGHRFLSVPGRAETKIC